MEPVQLTVSDFVAVTNQTLEYTYPSVAVVGEITEFKISQGKWVSFKLKDEGAAVNCFMGIYQLRMPLEDGMQVMVVAGPRLNPKGYFNLNVRTVKPVGEGSIKKGFELLKARLEAEGLFAPERKRVLPRVPQRIAVITSIESAAYADFCKIINERWGGLEVVVAHTQVQGDPAPDQIIRAIHYFNGLEELPEVLVIIRGGGSAEDLMTFNDELLARAVAESRIPTLVGVGHEIDHTLADMVADRRAATPTDAAKIVIPDRQEVLAGIRQQASSLGAQVVRAIDDYARNIRLQLTDAAQRIDERIDDAARQLRMLRLAAEQANPETVLRQGYALLRGKRAMGELLEIETSEETIRAEVQDVRKK